MPIWSHQHQPTKFASTTTYFPLVIMPFSVVDSDPAQALATTTSITRISLATTARRSSGGTGCLALTKNTKNTVPSWKRMERRINLNRKIELKCLQVYYLYRQTFLPVCSRCLIKSLLAAVLSVALWFWTSCTKLFGCSTVVAFSLSCRICILRSTGNQVWFWLSVLAS